MALKAEPINCSTKPGSDLWDNKNRWFSCACMKGGALFSVWNCWICRAA